MTSAPEPKRGQVIFLNGATSSGKTSIAEVLLDILDRPFFHLPVDVINGMRARRELPPEQLEQVLERTVLGYHRAVAGMVAAGNDVVVDHVLRERTWLLDCLNLLAGGDVVLVGVHCSAEELDLRERARGDRTPGRAAYHLARVHEGVTYDVECDTTSTSPEGCAAQIMTHLARPAAGRAFDQMRARFLPA
jgi:chloramphenicol 3-O phosphotransferase